MVVTAFGVGSTAQLLLLVHWPHVKAQGTIHSSLGVITPHHHTHAWYLCLFHAMLCFFMIS